MPELPEVETVRRGLEQKLNNFIIKNVEVCRHSTVAFPPNKEEFIAAWENKSLQFVPTNLRFCRRTRTVGNTMPESDGGPRVYAELIAAAATPTDLTSPPSPATKDVLGYLRSTGRAAGPGAHP